MENKVFSTEPYSHPKSIEFFTAVKLNHLQKVKEFLNDNKYLVYSYDYVYLTALHWAAKRGNSQISEVLIKYGADVNSRDIIGRTPLLLAINKGHDEIVQILLENKASPWSDETIDYKIAAKQFPKIARNLDRFRKIHIIVTLTPFTQKENMWDRQIQLLRFS
ncbi:hypothetical protein IMG5_056750 [Ichthyophthirius multifiliis]|uniref:Ankyrin repeat protein n=1 Tax=Ichthyophthirius multifiliis TaxID=5932 RepID=G0QNA4_ICHMU|nr:hypothetical protein IMG5_056750 [Ichthyophthirius multifiliis]EGR33296.1 hypothetical protein IMG5_056750 [Ichthyophthirius multifiliis]|eukprot:XP_004037282.1 hypothetical protein IMG5_056750 [Ichthyophthirius multifiliis]